MSGTPKFQIFKHHTQNPHFDVMIEYDGYVKSWIVPKSFPTSVSEKHLGIEVENAYRQNLERNRNSWDSYGTGDMEMIETSEIEIEYSNRVKIILILKGKSFSGKYIFLLPSWGKGYKKKLWILSKISHF